jgi:hypothetical protein
MKRTATLLGISFTIGAAAVAQPVLQSSDVGNVSLQLGIVSGVSTSLADGANQTWNVTSTPFTLLGTAVFGPAAGTPHAAEYPTATRAITSTVPGFPVYYTYWRTSTTALELMGDGIGSGLDDVYTDPQQLLEFPFNYLGDFTDSYNVVDGNSGDVTWTYSGYGTLITSNGTFNNVVKVHNDFYDRVVFWNKTPLYPILDIDFEGDGQVMVPAGGIGMAENTDGLVLAAYPNPAANELFLSGREAGDSYQLTDAIGRTIGTATTIMAAGTTRIDLSNVAPGSYLLRVQRAGTISVLSVVKQ